jgi:hypothetical protein
VILRTIRPVIRTVLSWSQRFGVVRGYKHFRSRLWIRYVRVLRFKRIQKTNALLFPCVRAIATTLLSVYYTVLWHFLGFCQLLQRSSGNSIVHPRQASNQGPWQEELRANRNVETKETVSAELLVFEDPSAWGWTGYQQQIGYAMASARSCHVSPDPGCSWQ